MKWLWALAVFVFSYGSAEDFTRFGYHRIATVSPPLHIACPELNAEVALKELELAVKKEVSVVLFPELSLTGYTAEDLFLHDDLLVRTKKALLELKKKSADLDLVFVVGAPYRTFDGRLYNCAFVIAKGNILGVIPKTYLPNYAEFYEYRFFVTGKGVSYHVDDPLLGSFRLSTNQLFQMGEMVFAVEICEDLWAPLPPSNYHALAGAHVILNLSASNELVSKSEYRRELVSQQSERLLAAYVYVSSGPTESSKDLVFGGHTMIFENGSKLAEGKRFQLQGERIFADIDIQKILHERQRNMTFGNSAALSDNYILHTITVKKKLADLARIYTKTPFVPTVSHDLHARAEEIFSIQTTGLARRLIAAKAKTMIIGLSGGLDSTLALLVAQESAKMLGWSLDKIIGVTMPGFGTSGGTKSAAYSLGENLGITFLEVPIQDAVLQHFHDIHHDPHVFDVTYENSQARERTQILFDLANQEKGILVGTGDLSELVLGWCTYNGDHMSNYGVNISVPKTLVMHLINWFANSRADVKLRETLEFILSIEISPELLPLGGDGKIVQTTESIVGPYLLHDFFIYHTLRNGFGVEKIFSLAAKTFAEEYSRAEIKKWLRVFIERFYQQQFKRTTLPPGPKVGSVSVSPRGDLRMPDEASCLALLRTIDDLE